MESSLFYLTADSDKGAQATDNKIITMPGQLVEWELSSFPSAEMQGPSCIDEVLTEESSVHTKSYGKASCHKLFLMANVLLLGVVWKQSNYKLHCVGSWVLYLPV